MRRAASTWAFYSGPWLDGIVQRYGMQPQIDFHEVFALTDNAHGTVEIFNEQLTAIIVNGKQK